MQITLGRSFIASRSLYWRSWTTRICRMEVVTIGILRSVFVTASANMRFHLVKCASIPMTDLLSRRLWPGQIYVTYPRTQDVCSVLSITLCWIISIVNADAKISALLCNNDHLADPRCWSSTGMMTPRLISLSQREESVYMAWPRSWPPCQRSSVSDQKCTLYSELTAKPLSKLSSQTSINSICWFACSPSSGVKFSLHTKNSLLYCSRSSDSVRSPCILSVGEFVSGSTFVVRDYSVWEFHQHCEQVSSWFWILCQFEKRHIFRQSPCDIALLLLEMRSQRLPILTLRRMCNLMY